MFNIRDFFCKKKKKRVSYNLSNNKRINDGIGPVS